MNNQTKAPPSEIIFDKTSIASSSDCVRVTVSLVSIQRFKIPTKSSLSSSLVSQQNVSEIYLQDFLNFQEK